ncbi:MAG: NUDIX domain-containing protein [Nanoarchaeota archaeon]
MKKRLTEKEFKSIYTRVPRLCVEIIIVNKKGILLTKRSIEPFNGLWHFPGGGVFFQETINQAIKRVAKNELGISVTPQKFLGYAEYPHDGFRHSVSLVFKCKISKKEKPRAIEQADDINFFNKIPKAIIPFHRKLLKVYLKSLLNKDKTSQRIKTKKN